MERTPKLVDTEDERRRRERRRREREREARHKDGKDVKDVKDGKHKSKKSNYHMDIIDKLDVTSIYGTGSESDPVATLHWHLLMLTFVSSVPSRRAFRCLQSQS